VPRPPSSSVVPGRLRFGRKSSTNPTPTPDDGSPATGAFTRIELAALHAPGFVADFQKASGSRWTTGDYNDDEQWFAKNRDPLANEQDIRLRSAVPSAVIAAGCTDWAGSTRFRSPLAQQEESATRTSQRQHGPRPQGHRAYMSGMAGLAYNRAATGRDITKIDDLWDPAFRGKVSMLSDTQDGLGMVMLSQGNSPETRPPNPCTRPST